MPSVKIPPKSLTALPITVCVPTTSGIRTISDIIRSGQLPPRPVVVASVNGVSYVVDGLDTLEAYEQTGMSDIPCVATKAVSVADAVCLHVNFSRRTPVNPFRVLEAVTWAEDQGAKPPMLDQRYERLARLSFDPKIPNMFGSWLERLSQKLDTLPRFWHVFGPLSKVPRSEQAKALESVMSFVFTMKAAPDPSTLRGILRQFAPAEPGSVEHVEAIPATAEPISDAPPNQKMYDDLRLDHTCRVSCECGKEWYVDVKRKVVRRVQNTDGLTVLTDDCGQPVYQLPPDLVKHLDCDGAPVHHYQVNAPFPAVLMSLKPVGQTALGRISQVLSQKINVD